LLSLLALVLCGLAYHLPASAAEAAAPLAAAAPPAYGDIIEVDAKERRVLIKHGRIQSIGMDPMTMEFMVTDAKAIKGLKAGDHVRFAASFKNGEYIASDIVVIKPAKRPAPAKATPPASATK
jgi:Cu(I)/Ag(I) efflux system periplasmic protein CusF